MAATIISNGLMIGGGLLTYAGAGLIRAARRFQLIKQLYVASIANTQQASSSTKDSGLEFDQQKQTFTRADKDGVWEFKWWGSKDLTEKEPELEIHQHRQAHGFYLLGKEIRYTTPAYVSVGHAMMPIVGGRPYEVEKTIYSLLLARKEGMNNSAYSYNRYTNYQCTGGEYLPIVYDTNLNSLNFRAVVKYIDNRCLDYYVTATSTSNSHTKQKDASIVDTGSLAQSLCTDKGRLAPPVLDVTPILHPPRVGLEFSVNSNTTVASTAIVPAAGNDPAGNLSVFFDNQLDIGQRVVEFDSRQPNEKGILDSRPIFFSRFKAMRHFNKYSGYYTRDLRDLYWRYGLDARLPLTFISAVAGSWLTWYNW
jgi:hypothetical protein